MSDAEENVVELEELVLHPGTYFNARTEVVVVVDDSTSVDQEAFESADRGAQWVRISDEVPIDSDSLDAAMEAFQASYHAGSRTGLPASALEHDDDESDLDDEPDDLDPDPDPDPEEPG